MRTPVWSVGLVGLMVLGTAMLILGFMEGQPK